MNLLRIVIDAAIEALRALIEIFTATSLSYSVYLPASIRELKSPSQVLDILRQSYFDLADSERPLAIGETTAFATLVMFGTAPNFAALVAEIEALLELFGMPRRATRGGDIPSMFEQWGGWPVNGRISTGVAPDWRTVRLSEFGVTASIVDELLRLEPYLLQARSDVDVLAARLQQINTRIQQILDQVRRIQLLLQRIAEAAVTTTGIQVLLVSGTGSTQTQTAAILASRASVEYPFNEAEACAYVALHVQAGSLGAILGLFNLMAVDGSPFDPIGLVREIASGEGRFVPADPDSVIRNPWGSG